LFALDFQTFYSGLPVEFGLVVEKPAVVPDIMVSIPLPVSVGAHRLTSETPASLDENQLFQDAKRGDLHAMAQLFLAHRERLCGMVRLRMDWRLRRRVDASDVVQEAYLDYARRFRDYCQGESLPFYLWLRQLTAQRLTDVHRRHLGAQMRDASMEAAVWRGPMPSVSTNSLASQLLGRITSASRALQRAEDQIKVQQALQRLKPIDREIIALRHFEMLSNDEIALTLNLTKTAASNRYVRALSRLKEELTEAGISFEM
jgi:RNA polymerase sigma-70 factor (ECF subfamily)